MSTEMNNLWPEYKKVLFYTVYTPLGMKYQQFVHMHVCLIGPLLLSVALSSLFLISPLHDRQGNNGPMEEPH